VVLSDAADAAPRPGHVIMCSISVSIDDDGDDSCRAVTISGEDKGRAC
jgi:hypothetical protein